MTLLTPKDMETWKMMMKNKDERQEEELKLRRGTRAKEVAFTDDNTAAPCVDSMHLNKCNGQKCTVENLEDLTKHA